MAGFDDLVSASAESLLTENLRMREGVTWNIGWTVLDSEKDPVDFTGATASLVIKDKAGGTALATITHSVVSGRQILLNNGSVVVSATPAGSGFSLTSDYHGVYELRITKDSKVISLVSGKVTIYRGV